MHVRKANNKLVEADERLQQREQIAFANAAADDDDGDRANYVDYSTNNFKECRHERETQNTKYFTFSHEEDHNHCSFVFERRSEKAIQVFNSKMCPTSYLSVNNMLTNFSIVNDFVFAPPRPTYTFHDFWEDNNSNIDDNNNYSNGKLKENRQHFVYKESDKNNCKYAISNGKCEKTQFYNTNSHPNHLCNNLVTSTEMNGMSPKYKCSASLSLSNRCNTCSHMELYEEEEYEEKKEKAQGAAHCNLKPHANATYELLFIPQNCPFSSYSINNKNNVQNEMFHKDICHSRFAQFLTCNSTIPCLVVKPKEMLSSHVAIYFHCNGEDIGHTQNDLLQALADSLHLLILSPEYPGYGLLTGNLSENSVKRSMERFIRFVFLSNPLLTPSQLILIGYSIGTGLAMHIAKVIHESFQSVQQALRLPKSFLNNTSTEIQCEIMCDMLRELEVHESSTELHVTKKEDLKSKEGDTINSLIGQNTAAQNNSNDHTIVNINSSSKCNRSSNNSELFRTHITCTTNNNSFLPITESNAHQTSTNCNSEQERKIFTSTQVKEEEINVSDKEHEPLSNNNVNDNVEELQTNIVKHEHTTSKHVESCKNGKCNRVNANTSCKSSLEESHLRTSHNVATNETLPTLCAHCALGGIILIAPFISLHAIENIKAFDAYKINLEELYRLEQTIPVNRVYPIPSWWNTLQSKNTNKHKEEEEEEEERELRRVSEQTEEPQRTQQLNQQSTYAEHLHSVKSVEQEHTVNCHLQRSKQEHQERCNHHCHHESKEEGECESAHNYSQVLLERERRPFIFRVAFYTTCERFANILIAQKLQQTYNYFTHTPLLLIHGTHDVMISPCHSIAMAAAIRQCSNGTAARVFITLVDEASHNNMNCTHFIRHFYKHQILYPHLERVAKEHALCRKELLLSQKDHHTKQGNAVIETCTCEEQRSHQHAEQFSHLQEPIEHSEELHEEENEQMEESAEEQTERTSESVCHDPADIYANVELHSNEPFCELHRTQEDHIRLASREVERQTKMSLHDQNFVNTCCNNKCKNNTVNANCAEECKHKESDSNKKLNATNNMRKEINYTTHSNQFHKSFFCHMPSRIWDLESDHEDGNYYAWLPFSIRWHLNQLRLTPQHYDVGTIMVEAMKLHTISAIDAERLYRRHVCFMWLCRGIAASMCLLFAFFILIVGIVHEIFTRSQYIAPYVDVSTSAHKLRHEPRIIAWSVIECTTMLTLFALRLLHARYSFGKWSRLNRGDYSWVLIYMSLRLLSIMCIFAIGVCMGMILAFASPHTIGVDWGRWDALPYYHRVWVSVVPRWTMVAAASLHLFVLILSAVKNH